MVMYSRIAPIGVAVASLLAASSPASAQYYPAYGGTGFGTTSYGTANWSGLYVGLHAGGAWTDLAWNIRREGLVPETVAGTDVDSGFLAGGHLGYNMQWSNLVLGAEVSIAGGDLDGHSARNALTGLANEASIGGIFTATARLGWAFDRWLAYVKGGYASANIDFTTDLLVNAVLTTTSHSSGREDGWTLGGGLEYAFSPNVIIGLEYNYFDFDAGDRLNAGVLPIVVDHRDVDAELHTVTARVSFKFGREPEPYVPLK